jgi:hypothetical protein
MRGGVRAVGYLQSIHAKLYSNNNMYIFATKTIINN